MSPLLCEDSATAKETGNEPFIDRAASSTPREPETDLQACYDALHESHNMRIQRVNHTTEDLHRMFKKDGADPHYQDALETLNEDAGWQTYLAQLEIGDTVLTQDMGRFAYAYLSQTRLRDRLQRQRGGDIDNKFGFTPKIRATKIRTDSKGRKLDSLDHNVRPLTAKQTPPFYHTNDPFTPSESENLVAATLVDLLNALSVNRKNKSQWVLESTKRFQIKMKEDDVLQVRINGTMSAAFPGLEDRSTTLAILSASPFRRQPKVSEQDGFVLAAWLLEKYELLSSGNNGSQDSRLSGWLISQYLTDIYLTFADRSTDYTFDLSIQEYGPFAIYSRHEMQRLGPILMTIILGLTDHTLDNREAHMWDDIGDFCDAATLDAIERDEAYTTRGYGPCQKMEIGAEQRFKGFPEYDGRADIRNGPSTMRKDSNLDEGLREYFHWIFDDEGKIKDWMRSSERFQHEFGTGHSFLRFAG